MGGEGTAFRGDHSPPPPPWWHPCWNKTPNETTVCLGDIYKHSLWLVQLFFYYCQHSSTCQHLFSGEKPCCPASQTVGGLWRCLTVIWRQTLKLCTCSLKLTCTQWCFDLNANISVTACSQWLQTGISFLFWDERHSSVGSQHNTDRKISILCSHYSSLKLLCHIVWAAVRSESFSFRNRLFLCCIGL